MIGAIFYLIKESWLIEFNLVLVERIKKVILLMEIILFAKDRNEIPILIDIKRWDIRECFCFIKYKIIFMITIFMIHLNTN